MCGIAGLLQFSADLSGTCDSVTAMVRHLRHRGPDGHGLTAAAHADPTVVLGHTRLAIIDLSAAGRQPMASDQGRLQLTYNGEIYNFKQLRQELGDTDWHSKTDTEVILRAYYRWGRDCLQHLRGMFAFALWDTARRRLFVARDRLGIKPLYYYTARENRAFVFASEVRALLASGLVPRRLDPIGLRQFLMYQSVPAPRTLIEGVRLLEPGHWLCVESDGSIVQQRYWDMLDSVTHGARARSGADSHARVAELLHESVALHRVSDVPVGAFLSGGIDSSAIVGLMTAAAATPRTFSVGFPEQAFDETGHARTVATRFRTNHTEIRLEQKDLLDQLPDAVAAMDQPTGDGVNTYVISRAVRAAGIKVALSGLGGDEVFAGYRSFARLQRAHRVLSLWGRGPKALRNLAASGVRVAGRSSIAADKRAALIASDGRLAQLYPPLRQVLSPHQVQSLLTPEWAEMGHSPDPYGELLEHAAMERARPDSFLSQVSYAEARTYMHDVLLRDTDQMSMAHGLEVRVPLLDHVLVECVLALPDRDKSSNGLPKRLLVESVGGLLPEEIVHREKQGFTLPFEPWMRGDLREYCARRLAEDRLGARGIFQPEQLTAMWDTFLEGGRGVSWSRLWILVTLEEWLTRNAL